MNKGKGGGPPQKKGAIAGGGTLFTQEKKKVYQKRTHGVRTPHKAWMRAGDRRGRGGG